MSPDTAVTSAPRSRPAAVPVIQPSFDELGTLLHEATFCVVDLETTGGSPKAGSRITEVGAVKVRAGEVLGELQTLVNPRSAIPPFIAVLTGITDAMVASAPTVETVLPSFLAFAEGCVLVAHNAPFDVGFLRHHAAELGHPWPGFDVVDTAVLARRVLTRDEAPNCKLGTLARVLGATTTPTHRALDDARATVDVLHSLIGRLGNLGVHTVEELATFNARVAAPQRRKRHLADALPHAPGVYLFRDAREAVLYVGTSRDLRTRVRSYFTASETRSRMGEMVAIAHRVDHVTCTTPLEAQVRELRLIAAHTPPYNRRSRHPERQWWVKLTREPWPRLALVRTVADDDADYLGPIARRADAESAVAALHEAFTIRRCSSRLGRRPRGSACALAEMGLCSSPCDSSVEADAYAAEVARVREAMLTDPGPVVEAMHAVMERLADLARFEEAGMVRDRLRAFLRASARTQRLTALTRCAQMVAARRDDAGRWEVHVVRHGRLAAAGVIPAGADARAWTDRLVAGAETVLPGAGPLPAATAEESELLLRWLESDGVRLVDLDGSWTCPRGGATRLLATYDAVEESRRTLAGFDGSRRTRTRAGGR